MVKSTVSVMKSLSPTPDTYGLLEIPYLPPNGAILLKKAKINNIKSLKETDALAAYSSIKKDIRGDNDQLVKNTINIGLYFEPRKKIDQEKSPFQMLMRVPGMKPNVANHIIKMVETDPDPKIKGKEPSFVIRNRSTGVTVKDYAFDLFDRIMTYCDVAPAECPDILCSLIVAAALGPEPPEGGGDRIPG